MRDRDIEIKKEVVRRDREKENEVVRIDKDIEIRREKRRK